MSARDVHRTAQRGMVLITSLLLLIVVTILAVGMFRSFGLDEKIAGNVREKHRALNAAETAEQYAEWWLASGNGSTGTACAAVVPAATGQVCTLPLGGVGVDISQVPMPWTAGVSYVPSPPSAATAMNAPGNPGAAGGQNAYYAAPIFYITYLGPSPSASAGSIYQIDAAGYAGSADTAAIVESTYMVQQNSSCKSCGP